MENTSVGIGYGYSLELVPHLNPGQHLLEPWVVPNLGLKMLMLGPPHLPLKNKKALA